MTRSSNMISFFFLPIAAFFIITHTIESVTKLRERERWRRSPMRHGGKRMGWMRPSFVPLEQERMVSPQNGCGRMDRGLFSVPRSRNSSSRRWERKTRPPGQKGGKIGQPILLVFGTFFLWSRYTYVANSKKWGRYHRKFCSMKAGLEHREGG